MKITTQVIVSSNSEVDNEISELESEATKLRHIDFERAIECLKRVKEIRHKADYQYGLESYLRLAKFYFQADYIKEAIAELEYLISSSNERRINYLTQTSDPDFLKKLVAEKMNLSEHSVIYNELSSIYKKINNIEKMHYFLELSQNCEDEAEKLEEQIENEHLKWLEEKRIQRMQRRNKR